MLDAEFKSEVKAPPWVGHYQWRISRSYSNDVRSGGFRSYFNFSSTATASPGGYVTELEGMPICSQAAVGVQDVTGIWRQEYECDNPKEGRVTPRPPIVVTLHDNHFIVTGIDFRLTPEWDGGYMYEHEYRVCGPCLDECPAMGTERAHWGHAAFIGHFLYKGAGVSGVQITDGVMESLPGSMRLDNLPVRNLPGTGIKMNILNRIDMEAECEALDLSQPASITTQVTARMPTAIVNHSLTSAQITALTSGTRPRAGLTLVAMDPKPLEMTTAHVPAKFGGRKCLWVHELSVDISYPSVTVYIPKEYAVGSCNYNASKEHEMEHVVDAASLLEEFKGRFTAAMAAGLPYKHLPVPVEDTNNMPELEAITAANLTALYDQFKTAAQKKVNERDTNYAIVLAKCSTW